MKRNLVLALFLVGSLFGCVSKTPQTEALLVSTRSLPLEARVEGVPFIEQSANYCGPATLAMALSWAGKSVSLEELGAQVYTPGMKGSLQTDMISAVRRQGFMALPIVGLQSLLQEVAAGHPVIVFENLALSWLPQWHYAVVFGYNLRQETVLMHSGPEKDKVWDLRKFERSWKLADYWGLVVLPPERLSATADELAHVKAAAALEQIGKTSEAEKSYLQILSRWPQSLGAKVGVANISYAQGDYKRSREFLRAAAREHPGSSAVKNNLAVAEKAYQEALAKKNKAPR